jgi:hypothetical protein
MRIHGGKIPFRSCIVCKARFSAQLVTYQGTHRLVIYTSFRITYLDDFFVKLCREQAIVILNHENVNICTTCQVEAHHRTYKRQIWWQSGIRLINLLDSGFITLNNIWAPAQSAVQNLNCRSKKIQRKETVTEKIHHESQRSTTW